MEPRGGAPKDKGQERGRSNARRMDTQQLIRSSYGVITDYDSVKNAAKVAIFEGGKKIMIDRWISVDMADGMIDGFQSVHGKITKGFCCKVRYSETTPVSGNAEIELLSKGPKCTNEKKTEDERAVNNELSTGVGEILQASA